MHIPQDDGTRTSADRYEPNRHGFVTVGAVLDMTAQAPADTVRNPQFQISHH